MNSLMLAKEESKVKTLNDVNEWPERSSSAVTEMNAAIKELVKYRAEILDTRNPRIRTREISFLQKKELEIKGA